MKVVRGHVSIIIVLMFKISASKTVLLECIRILEQ